MALRRILTIDNPADLAVLKQVSTPVEGPVTDELRALMDDMLETMYAAPGIGLAAVQIGDTRRVIVMDLGDGEPEAGADDAAEGEDEPKRRPNPAHTPARTRSSRGRTRPSRRRLSWMSVIASPSFRVRGT